MKIKLIKFKSVKSTNDIAIKLIRKEKVQPTLIFSEKIKVGCVLFFFISFIAISFVLLTILNFISLIDIN